MGAMRLRPQSRMTGMIVNGYVFATWISKRITIKNNIISKPELWENIHRIWLIILIA